MTPFVFAHDQVTDHNRPTTCTSRKYAIRWEEYCPQRADIMVTILSCHFHVNLPGVDVPHSLAFGGEGPLPADHAAVKSKSGR